MSLPAVAQFPAKYKVVLLGESNVGKTSMILRIVKDTFNPEQRNTVGASFFRHAAQTSTSVVLNYDIWDTAGQERYRGLASLYYRGAAAAILVYDVTNAESLEKARYWVGELRRAADVGECEGIVIVLVGNKIDLEANRVVSTNAGRAMAEENGCFFVEASAKTGTGVPDVFKIIGDKVFEINAPAMKQNEEGLLTSRNQNSANKKSCRC